jgi:hypothetical protein
VPEILTRLETTNVYVDPDRLLPGFHGLHVTKAVRVAHSTRNRTARPTCRGPIEASRLRR